MLQLPAPCILSKDVLDVEVLLEDNGTLSPAFCFYFQICNEEPHCWKAIPCKQWLWDSSGVVQVLVRDQDVFAEMLI